MEKLIGIETVVYHKNKPRCRLNRGLLFRQDAWGNLDKIKALHEERLELEDMMNEVLVKVKEVALYSKDERALEDELMLYDSYYDLIEYELQEQWNFTQDSNYFRFWDRPGCLCPKMDNEDAYPYGRYVRQGNCPLHGYEVRQAVQEEPEQPLKAEKNQSKLFNRYVGSVLFVTGLVLLGVYLEFIG